MIENLRIKELGQLVDLFVRGGHLADAQKYLDEMQARVDAAKEAATMPGILETKPGWEEKPRPAVAEAIAAANEANEILQELPMVETDKPYCNEAGDIVRISAQPGRPGYDPEIHLNLELKILCDGELVPTAHTADAEAGIVWYYEKNAQGRIKTLTKHGKVEIRGLK